MFRLNQQLIPVLLVALLLSASCQSQSLLPFSDLSEIEKNRSILAALTCEELSEKASDKSFALKNLAAMRAYARCTGVNFQTDQLSDFEKRLYALEVASLEPNKKDPTGQSDPTFSELKISLDKEKSVEAKFKIYKQLRLKYKRNGDRQDYIKTTRNLYRWALKNFKKNPKDQDSLNAYYEAAQLSVRTHWTEDDSKTSNVVLNEAFRLLKKTSVAELLYLKGRILEEMQKTSEAISQYNLLIDDIAKYNPKALSFSQDRLLWVKSWILYKEKNYEAAEKAFLNLSETTVDLSEKSRAQFFQARSLKFLGKDKEAQALFESITQSDFFGYYGLVSYREIGKKLPAINDIKSSSSLNYDLRLGFLKPEEKEIFTELIKYRELNLAERAIIILQKSKSDEVNLSLYLAKKSQLYISLFRAFSKLDNNEKIDVFLNYPNLIFPQPYQDQVEEMSSKTNVPSSLIYSIMKQESAFNEKARSGADAMGLMQVIPKLAKQISKKFDVPYRQPQDLFDPIVNIQLGSFELMEQVKKQNGQLTYVAAAYNAGPGALASWLKTRKRDDVLEFIEEIPYDETRTYVKLIARNKLFYERISKRDSEHDFPADFLN